MKTNKTRFNKGTIYGYRLLLKSLQKCGPARSIVTDKNGEIICGNDVFKAATELNIKTRVVETTGDELIVVKRMDVTANEKKALEIALLDNLCQDKNLYWDADALHKAMTDNLSFDPREWGAHSCLVKELDLTELLRDDVDIKTKERKKDEADLSDNMQLSLFDEFNFEE